MPDRDPAQPTLDDYEHEITCARCGGFEDECECGEEWDPETAEIPF